MIYDYLVVGHGLAGAILTCFLEKAGKTVLVVDAPKENSASRVAAGLINPVAGKRFAKSWQIDAFLPAAAAFYQEMEERYQTRLFHRKPILKLFSTAEEQNNWMGKSTDPAWDGYIETTHLQLPVSEYVHQELGGLLIQQGGYVALRSFLDLRAEDLRQRGAIRLEALDLSLLELSPDTVRYKEITARNIVFCEGAQGAQNPFFSWLPFSLNKGEILDINMPDFEASYIYNKAVYVVPLGQTHYRVGATYNWRNLEENLTQEAREELTAKAQDILKKPFTVTKQYVGVRPAVRDRKPLVGVHPQHPRIGIFNGMGSKGVLMAPLLAQQFISRLEQGTALWPEVDIVRYLSLYLASTSTT
ncbi:NAD(P)/FAD-dependent oxidoreductase [Rufibacter glacialis]|uniref:FAD-dependent oxidoreductase n=1 Tax=Rufibacter glacialis TaxID=1259555 RepID=A0A5M8QR35_9BACT|nr:FAD-dependent oxidoreductase [Rufibacter glacialis]KAA6437106.1 FAD-dependent oxidoreductase [Rufibacter glacialis]GGK62042.1 FAD-dependent oxidoreductase [Rufibacter glacialis]